MLQERTERWPGRRREQVGSFWPRGSGDRRVGG